VMSTIKDLEEEKVSFRYPRRVSRFPEIDKGVLWSVEPRDEGR